MPTRPLPSPSSIDVSTPEAWTWWNANPPWIAGRTRSEFWSRRAAMTIPQYLALYLGRAPEQVSCTATNGTFDHIHRTRDRWQVVFMPRYPRIFRASHRGTVFRFDPRRLTRRLPATNPFAAMAAWATADTVFEDRFLAAALSTRLTWSARIKRVGDYLRVGAAAGYIADVGVWRSPVVAIAPSRAAARALRVPAVRVRHYRLAHHLVALEAAIALRLADGTLPFVTGIADDAALSSAVRQRHGALPARGTQLGAVPDLAVTIGEGRTTWVELLSRNYDGHDIAAKYAALRMAVEFVATSRRIAARAAAGRPAMQCYHF